MLLLQANVSQVAGARLTVQRKPSESYFRRSELLSTLQIVTGQTGFFLFNPVLNQTKGQLLSRATKI